MTQDGAVKVSLRDGTGLITLSHGPVNRLDETLTAALAHAVTELLAGTATRAIVLRAEGSHFATDADPAAPAPPGLDAVLERLDRAPVPVLAVLQGPAIGAGAALALAAHGRLSAPGVTLSLPGIAAGLLPAGGTIQRLCRIAGVDLALDLCLTGRRMSAPQAHARGLVDRVIDGDLTAAAFAAVQDWLAAGQGPIAAPCRPVPAPAFPAIAAARARPRPNRALASDRIIDCAEASQLLPWDSALAFEAEARADAFADPAGRAMRHVLQAERSLSPHLLARDADGRSVLSARGLDLAGSLRAAWILAAQALARAGRPPSGIDAAARHWGFATGPFGSDTPPAPGPDAEPLHAALLAECARLIDAGRVAGPDEADLLAILGAGFPRWRGGPVFAATETGLAAMVQRCVSRAADDPVWQIPDALRRAAISGRGWG